MNRWPRLGILIVVVSLIALSLIGAATAAPASPAEQVQAAWQAAQAAGVYQYTTEIVQTTYPAPMLVNVGRSAREDRLYIEGQTNLPNREMLMTLWQNGGNVVTGRDGVEVRIAGDEAFGRKLPSPAGRGDGGEGWEKVENFSGTFAPGQDLLAYLAEERTHG